MDGCVTCNRPDNQCGCPNPHIPIKCMHCGKFIAYKDIDDGHCKQEQELPNPWSYDPPDFGWACVKCSIK